MAKKILAVGGTSAIMQAVLRHYAKEGAEIFVTGRSAQKLTALEKDLTVRGAAVLSHHLDVTDRAEIKNVVKEACERLKSIDVVLLGHGSLGDQAEAAQNYEKAEREIQINFLSYVQIITTLSRFLKKQGNGTIAAISSVAGDRGRKSNYIYGCAKGALNVYLQGLRNELCDAGIRVLTIKPGFVDTPMTKDVKKNFLFASADKAGQCIVNGIENNRDVIYVPVFWQFIMFCIKSIPEFIFKKLNL